MAYITMCRDDDCEKCNKCYRYKAIPSKYQSYAIFGYDELFSYFIPIPEGDTGKT